MANNFFSTVDPLYGLENIPGVLNLPGAENYLTGQQFGGGVEGLIKGINTSQNLDPVLGTINTLANTVYGVKKGGETGMSNLSTMQKLRQDLIKSGIDITKGGIDIQKGRFDLQKAPFELANIAYQASQGQFDANARNNLMNLIQSLPPEQQLQALADPKTWYTKTLEAGMPTTDIKEYEYGQLKGPEFYSYLEKMKKAGSPSTTIKMPEQEKMMLESDIKTLDSLVSASNAARSIATKTQDIDAILGDMPGGGIVKLGADLQAYLGLPTEKAQKSQVVQAIATKGATEIRAPGSGSTSDLEFNAYRTAFPTLATTAQGRKLMVRMANASASRASKLTDWARTRMKEGTFTYEGLREYDDSLGKVITADLKKALDVELQKSGKNVSQYDYSAADALVGIEQ